MQLVFVETYTPQYIGVIGHSPSNQSFGKVVQTNYANKNNVQHKKT